MGPSVRGAHWLFAVLIIAFASPAAARDTCGEVVTLKTHGGTTTRYSLAMPETAAEMALVLLPGGEGDVTLDAKGCATALKGNSLIVSRDLFRKAGFATALVDTPSDHRGGLGGFRLSPLHAEDVGKVIADVRARAKVPVWLAGTSRGTISAANAASRLGGAAAPDGLILTSPITSGKVGGRKPWVAQTVFDARLGAIHMPLLVVAHSDDTCPRTPPHFAPRILAQANGAREQSVTVTGGPGRIHGSYTVTCSGRAPHGFIDQHAEVAAGIARFVRGGKY